MKKKSIHNPKFSKRAGSEFSKTLKYRVNEYFKGKGISKHANSSMVLKTVLMLTLFVVPLTIINMGIISSPWMLFLLYITSGLGMAGIGMGIMHDAIHGSYSKNKTVNRYLGYTMNLVGASETVWRIQHNVLHHTYPNISGADDDINAPFFLRFSPNAQKYWLHKYQYIYAWFFYCLSTLSWITTKDFVRINRYRKMGFLNKKNEFKKEVFKVILWKLVYYAFALGLPLYVLPIAPWIIITAFLCMHFVTGFLISTVFQIAHIMPTVEFPMADEDGLIEGDWSLHQMATTTNFSPDNKVFSWLIGGLNYQVEHHLLPHVCHVHYKDLSAIVAETAREFGMPYHSKKSLGKALGAHISMLYQLGQSTPDSSLTPS